MSRLCLPSTAVRDAAAARVHELDGVAGGVAGDETGGTGDVATPAAVRRLVEDCLIWTDVAQSPPSGVQDVEFWVPPFLTADVEGSRAAVAALSRLRVIQTQSAGVDTVLSLVPDGVLLCDAQGVHGSSTSEWALAAILSVLREFPRFERARQQQRWDYSVTDELAGKRVLVVGAGDVGRQLGRRLVACDAGVRFVGRTPREGVHGIDELPGLLPEADVVVLIVPKTSQTIGMVDAGFLARMHDGALLVNAARGPVVDTDALLAQLTTGRLRAAVDVVEPEPLPADHPLWNAPNLLITPHVAGSVLGLTQRFAALLVDQLSRFEAGDQLRNVVSGEY